MFQNSLQRLPVHSFPTFDFFSTKSYLNRISATIMVLILIYLYLAQENKPKIRQTFRYFLLENGLQFDSRLNLLLRLQYDFKICDGFPI